MSNSKTQFWDINGIFINPANITTVRFADPGVCKQMGSKPYADILFAGSDNFRVSGEENLKRLRSLLTACTKVRFLG